METKNQFIAFNGKVVDIEQMDVMTGTKGWHTFQVVRHPGGAAVLPLHEDGSVTLIRQLRPAIDQLTFELPAGRLGLGEDPKLCAARELIEETGLESANLVSLGILHPSPGVFDEVIHLFMATNLIQGEAQPEAYEDIETFRMPLERALKMACSGEITDGKTITALFRAERLLK